MTRVYDEASILREGLAITSKQQGQVVGSKASVDKFRSIFGVLPSTVLQIFSDIRNKDLVDNEESIIEKPVVKKLLVALMWLKMYLTEEQLSSFTGSDMKTIRQNNWKYTKAIAALKVSKIDATFNLEDEIAEIPITVDGTHCPIEEPRKEPSKTWYSHKFHGPGLAYEIALLIHKPQIVWINGPFKAGESDTALFTKPNGLREKLVAAGKLAVADDGYKGQLDTLITKNPFYSNEVTAFCKRARARQESVNKRLKDFKVASSKFRHGHMKHGMCFHAVAVLLQYDMDNGMPLFDF